MDETYYTESAEQTEQLGRCLAQRLDKTSFVALYGDLGAGKTAFVRGMASVLCPLDRVSSPTYTIVNEYLTGEFPLYHFDLYRIKDDDDLYSTGFYDYMGNGVCVCEWCENIPQAIPPDAICVKIEKPSSELGVTSLRKITFSGAKP